MSLFLVLGPSASLSNLGGLELLYNLVNSVSIRINWAAAGFTTYAPVPLMVLCEIQIDYRDSFSFGIFPDIQLCPM